MREAGGRQQFLDSSPLFLILLTAPCLLSPYCLLLPAYCLRAPTSARKKLRNRAPKLARFAGGAAAGAAGAAAAGSALTTGIVISGSRGGVAAACESAL